MAEKYYTVSDRAHFSFKIENSRFIGHISQTENIEQAEKFISEIKSEHDDATHNVVAYRIKNNPIIESYDDDGEPSGSAGKPALNILQKEKLENVTSVITRYYGGKELGYGGLVRAYSESVKKVIEKAEKIEVIPHKILNLEVKYDDISNIKKVLNKNNLEFKAEYKETVNFNVKVPENSLEKICDNLMSATSGRVDIK